MTKEELRKIKEKNCIEKYPEYALRYFKGFNYGGLRSSIMSYRKRKGKDYFDYNDIIIMLDTETSKEHENVVIEDKGIKKYLPVDNYVVAWTVSIRAYHRNIVTLYGSKPSELCYCLDLIHSNLAGNVTLFYCHNFAYDYVFLRQFLFDRFGHPAAVLNTKPHYPISMEFSNGIIIRDSLILSQRSLAKWAKDMNVEHQKAMGKWNYNKHRNQYDITEWSEDEKEYIEHDTLAGVECLDKLCELKEKQIFTLPLTQTGFVREAARDRAKIMSYHKTAVAQTGDLIFQRILENIFHGGYVHGYRYIIDKVITEIVEGYDFASSYPYVMLAYKYPSEHFCEVFNADVDSILAKSEDYAFTFKLKAAGVELKNYYEHMPALQYSKAKTVNAIVDNGRILCAEYVEIWLNEVDLEVINSQYKWKECKIEFCKAAIKKYLPKWFTDLIYQYFVDKTMLKGKDKVLYAIKKGELNSNYGMTVQKPLKDEIMEDYDSGEYVNLYDKLTPQELIQRLNEDYEKHIKSRKYCMPFQWGVWVTSYAFRNLFKLGACCDNWIYSDTDSCYGIGWYKDMVDAYNENCKKLLLANGYGPVNNGREYWLGVAEHDPEEDTYTEFKVLGAKRYCGRQLKDGQLHITVAGVPKSGAKCLNDDIRNFTKGFVFPGTETGKLLHTYIYHEDIQIDENGNEYADSIDLTPCDYLMDAVEVEEWDSYDNIPVYLHTYEED